MIDSSITTSIKPRRESFIKIGEGGEEGTIDGITLKQAKNEMKEDSNEVKKEEAKEELKEVKEELKAEVIEEKKEVKAAEKTEEKRAEKPAEKVEEKKKSPIHPEEEK